MPDRLAGGIAALWLLGMVRPRVHPGVWLRADHNWNTCVWLMKLFMLAFWTIAAVQLPAPVQNGELGPPNAFSKNGCGAGVPPPADRKVGGGVGLREALAAQRHHGRNGIEIALHPFVGNDAADVTDFKQHFRPDFALDAEGEVVRGRRPEAGIEHRSRARRRLSIGADKCRLGQRLRRSRYRRRQTIGSNAERGRRSHTAAPQTLAARGSANAGNRLAETYPEERNQHQTNAIQTAIDLAVSAANDGLAVTEELCPECRR